MIFTLILGGSLQSIDPLALFWDQLRLLLINFILVNLWEETAWAGVMQTRLERRHNIFLAAALTAVPFGFIHLPLAFLSEITIASVLISLAAYILLVLFLRPLVAVVLRGSRDSLLAAGLMHSISTAPTTTTASQRPYSTGSSTGSESSSQLSYTSPP